MTGCRLSEDQLRAAVAFHGHWCPGLALGVRAAELALEEVGPSGDEDVVAVTETDMCAVDAVQVLTGDPRHQARHLERGAGGAEGAQGGVRAGGAVGQDQAVRAVEARIGAVG